MNGNDLIFKARPREFDSFASSFLSDVGFCHPQIKPEELKFKSYHYLFCRPLTFISDSKCKKQKSNINVIYKKKET